MNSNEIEKRLEVLEAEVALLKSKSSNKNDSEKPWWKQRVGMFADNPAYDEAMRLGREYRDSQQMTYDEDGEE